MQLNLAIIAIGSNLRIPLDDLKFVPHLLIANVKPNYIKVESVSTYYRTPAYPAESGPDFINAAFLVNSKLLPQNLLKELHKIENKFNRERPYRWAPRTLDLDLIFYNDLILPNKKTWNEWADLTPEEAQTRAPTELILPHPRAHERSFVLGPINDIAPNFVHPIYNKTIQALWQNLPEQDRASLTPL